jgi:hypothetical protein
MLVGMGTAERPAGKGFSIGSGENGRKIPRWRERTQPSVARRAFQRGRPVQLQIVVDVRTKRTLMIEN